MIVVRPLDNVLNRLDGVKATGSGYSARCPAPDHDDRHNSLGVNEGADGRVLVKCYRGCTVDAITTGMGLRPADLFPPREGGRGGDIPRRNTATVQQSPIGCTLAAYAEAKRLC